MSNSTIQKSQIGTGNSQSNSMRTNKPSTTSTSRPKGKSKYAKKSRSKKNQKPVAVKRGPVNLYLSVCCQSPAVKPLAGELPSGSKERKGLGHWRCSGCRKACKVTVGKTKAPDVGISPTGAKVTFGTVEGDDMGRGTGTEVPIASAS